MAMQFIFSEKSVSSKYVSQSISTELAICILDMFFIAEIGYMSHYK